ncbi:MAG TPA: FHA domain-containing protein [Solirubrobacter sp.]|nr:FHA domain-containing protein [Solirubrobacter sp.]
MEPHTATAVELKERLQAERTARALVVYRDGEGHQRIHTLVPEHGKVTVGRGPATDLRLAWDREVSRAHAELEHIGGEWTVSDDGLSTNGTYRNDERVRGRVRLKDGDLLRFGKTVVAFRAPELTEGDTTALPEDSPPPPITPTQRNVLVALCRPLRDNPYATPATNSQIASEVHLGVDAIKVHLRALYRRFGIESLPQNEKRARLAELAIQRGLVDEP